MAEFCAACAICFASELYGRERYPSDLVQDEHGIAIDELRSTFRDALTAEGKDSIRNVWNELTAFARTLPHDLDSFRIARLRRGDRWFGRSHGTTGAFLLVAAMAELARRAWEHAFEEKLPEEDEVIFGALPSAKEVMFGTTRLLDGTRTQKLRAVRSVGLDYGVALRWYVEGQTEYYALHATFVEDSHISIIDLGGRVVERKSVAFRDNLRDDISKNIFSFVSFDGDRSDNLRAIRSAAKSGEIVGRVYVATPDFEFHNFTPEELIDCVVELGKEEARRLERPEGAIEELRRKLREAASGCRAMRELQSVLREVYPDGANLVKTRRWGELLATTAIERPMGPGGDGRLERPLIDAIKRACWSETSEYIIARDEWRIDPDTLQTVRRTSPL